MESCTARKRPWEEDNPTDIPLKRRDSSGKRSAPPLPQHADRYPRDSQTQSQRRLPPLYTPSYIGPAAPHTSGSSQLSIPAHDTSAWGTFKPRSQSLFDVSQTPQNHRRNSEAEHITSFPETLDLHRSLPPIGSNAPQSRSGIEPAHACCLSDCGGQGCSSARSLMRKLASELILLDARVRSISQKDYQLFNQPPEIEHAGHIEALQWALDIVQWTNIKFQDHIENSAARSPDQSHFQLDTLSSMRRGQQHIEQREEQSPPPRQFSGSQHPQHGYSGFTHPGAMHEDSRRNPYAGDMMPMANSPHHTASSSGSTFMPPQSPMQGAQPSRPTMLPSPSSMNFPSASAPNLPPISPPPTTLHNSAQAIHLQDLQHQVSVKTLAFQTLQREYDSLLQKLERQRTKCATLEKKFEVSDVEINSLTEEKEKLQAQVVVLESQVEDLQQSRDEARRQLVANGAQYMRIMEMANRLQAQSADDKKRWEAERGELEHRIKILEEAMVTGSDQPICETGPDSAANPPPITLSHNHINSSKPTSSSVSSSAETIHVLRVEIGRLRSRTQTLEAALQTMREESISIQAAAKQLVESGDKIENVSQAALGG